jgi:hypothetical protein
MDCTEVPVTPEVQASAAEHGFEPNCLAMLPRVIVEDIAAAKYDGARVILGRGGNVAFDSAIGFRDRNAGRPLLPGAVILRAFEVLGGK